MTARSGTKIQLTGAVREPALLRHWRRREAEFLRAWRPYDAELGREEGLKGGTTCCVVQAGIVMMAEQSVSPSATPSLSTAGPRGSVTCCSCAARSYILPESWSLFIRAYEER